MSLVPIRWESPQQQASPCQIQYHDFLIRLIEGHQSSPMDEERLREMNFCKHLPAHSDLARLRLSDEAVRRIATDCRFSWLASTIASSLDHHDINYTAAMVCELVAQTTIYFHHRELPTESSYLPQLLLQEKSSLIDQLRPSLTRLVASIALEQASVPALALEQNSLTVPGAWHSQLSYQDLAEAITLIQRLADGDVLVQADFVADDLLAWLLGHWWGPMTVTCDNHQVFEAHVGHAGSHLLYMVAGGDATGSCGCYASSGRRLLISRRTRTRRSGSLSPSERKCITVDSSREASVEPEMVVQQQQAVRRKGDCRMAATLKHLFQNIHISGNAIVHLGDLFHQTEAEGGSRRTRLRPVRSDPTADRARRIHRRALAEVFRDGRPRSPIRKHRPWRRGVQ